MMARDYWFRPKTHGYGADAANWKGWLAILAYVAASLLLSFLLVIGPALQGARPSTWSLLIYFAALGALTVGFMALVRAKTDGDWRWRWGEDDRKP